ncbi:uncharacterized protein I303_102234 [Kwoniella dejecticola CBS 10117]|uniref:Major facilitator superfamily (MFS) profile domain-containing protein n=1 Tax=Kwoniella dejecticola CBS 10117 TaxID=1296121 RepID=A0AAJ8KLI2_9TREE
MPYLGLRGTKLLVAISATAGVGFCLFGIDNAALGGVISSGPFERKYNLDPTGQGAITGSYEIGCFFGALAFAIFGERFSRRIVLLFCCIPLMVGTVLQVASYGTAQLAVGRVIAGLAMGGITTTLPIWQNETSPAHLRGTLVCASLSMLIVGQLIAYWTAYGLLDRYDTDFTWRLMFSLQGMAGIIMAGLLWVMPESPRWLLSHSQPEAARRVLSALLDLPTDAAKVSQQINEISKANELERESAKGWSDLLRKGDDQGEKRRMLTVSHVVLVCQAFSGSTILSYYLTTIFQDAVGLTPHISTLLSGYLQIWFLIASFATWWLIEHAGRRNLFLITAFGMAVVMFIMGGLIKVGSKGAGIGATVMVFLYQA